MQHPRCMHMLPGTALICQSLPSRSTHAPSCSTHSHCDSRSAPPQGVLPCPQLSCAACMTSLPSSPLRMLAVLLLMMACVSDSTRFTSPSRPQQSSRESSVLLPAAAAAGPPASRACRAAAMLPRRPPEGCKGREGGVRRWQLLHGAASPAQADTGTSRQSRVGASHTQSLKWRPVSLGQPTAVHGTKAYMKARDTRCQGSHLCWCPGPAACRPGIVIRYLAAPAGTGWPGGLDEPCAGTCRARGGGLEGACMDQSPS